MAPWRTSSDFHLRRAQIAAFKRFAHAVSAAEGITPGLYGMLQAIGNNPGLSQSALAVAMERRPFLDRQGRRSTGGKGA